MAVFLTDGGEEEMVFIVKRIDKGIFAVRHRYTGRTEGTRATQADAQRLALQLNRRIEERSARRPLLTRFEEEARAAAAAGGMLDEQTSQS